MHLFRRSIVLAVAISCAPAADSSPEPSTEGDETLTTEEGSLSVLSGPDALVGGAPTEVSGFGGVECGRWVSAGARGVIVHCEDPDGPEGLLHLVDGLALLDGVADVFATVSGVFVATGSAAADIGDLDGDGDGELGLRANTGSGEDLGRVLPGEAWTGDVAIGDVAWRLSGEQGDMGLAPQVVADTDGDGGADLVVVQEATSYVDDASVGTRLYVTVGTGFAGAGGGTRVEVPALAGRALVGTRALGAPRAVHGIGDVDGDGLEDLGVAFGPWEEPGEDRAGELRVVLSSRADDSLDSCPAIRGVQVGRWMGVVFAPVGDVDGDGLGELVLGFVVEGADGSSSRHLELGVVRGAELASGADTEISPWTADLQGYAGVACDLDGDGVRDWVTADGIWDGTSLLEPDPTPIAGGVTPLACLGDLDGDGAEELALGDG